MLAPAHRALAAIALVAAIFSCEARAQTAWPTPTGVAAANGSVGMCLNGSVQAVPCSSVTPFPVAVTPTADSAVGITPVVSAALESNHVIKASAGNFYSGYITTGAVAGWLLLANSTSAPTAGGAAIAPLACVIAPANLTTSISAPVNAPMIFSTGITMVFSTSGCLTNTASATAFFSGMAK